MSSLFDVLNIMKSSSTSSKSSGKHVGFEYDTFSSEESSDSSFSKQRGQKRTNDDD